MSGWEIVSIGVFVYIGGAFFMSLFLDEEIDLSGKAVFGGAIIWPVTFVVLVVKGIIAFFREVWK